VSKVKEVSVRTQKKGDPGERERISLDVLLREKGKKSKKI